MNLKMDSVYKNLYLLDPENGHKKKASSYYFFRIIADRSILTRETIFDSLKAFSFKKEIVKPFRLVVDCQTQCDFYLKEINAKEEILYHDQFYVFFEFLNLKVFVFKQKNYLKN